MISTHYRILDAIDDNFNDLSDSMKVNEDAIKDLKIEIRGRLDKIDGKFNELQRGVKANECAIHGIKMEIRNRFKEHENNIRKMLQSECQRAYSKPIL